MKGRMIRLLPYLCTLLTALVALSPAGSSVRATAGNGPPMTTLQQTVPGTLPRPHQAGPKKKQPSRTRVMPQPTSKGERIGRRHVLKVIGDPVNPALYAFTDNGWMYRSADYGQSWIFVTQKAKFDDFIMSATDENVLYRGSGRRCALTESVENPFFRSRNGGVTWTEVADGADLVPMLTDPADRDRVYAADCTMLFVSEDGGDTWQFRADDSDEMLWDIYRVQAMAAAFFAAGSEEAPAHIFAAGNAESGTLAVGYSADGGLEWSRITADDGRPRTLVAMAAHISDSQRLWLLDTTGVWATEDRGASWALLAAGLESVELNDIVAHPDGRLFLASSDGLYQIKADSARWNRVTGENFTDFAVVDLVYNVHNPWVLWLNTDRGVFRYQIP